MNPHNDNKDEAKDEEQIASVLKAAETDAAPPDADVLARVRTQSTETFSAASVGQSKRQPFYRRVRWFAPAAAAVVIGVGLYFWLSAAPSLGQALETLDTADTLHVRFTSHNHQQEFWHTSRPNRSRVDGPYGIYQIADEISFSEVSENKVTRTSATPTKPSHRILGLFWVGPHAKVLSARPVEHTREGGLDLFVYRVDLLSDHPKTPDLRLEARVIAQTRRLHSMRTDFIKADGMLEPYVELTGIAYNEPIGADKFAIADTLTEDGRIGKVNDVQGIVAVKPVLHNRWTPLREGLVLKPGDWIRTDARGANATSLRLVKQTGVILGPKTLIELIGPKQIRLIEGEAEITAAAGTSIDLLGPAAQKITVKGKQFYRALKQQLARVEKDPPWLLGFKGATANEALGSLVALVDGRNVPLTVGYHKVSVDIRDQIARTVIEESFVNHTDTQLEGVFYFPLPQDASISGFGMWIGDQLVEADVVEKQRAREIYETILRERRDPGLLEWSGGNIFKARVFPILPHSEKRIKISYTQVLPLKGSRYRYSYALQSEMLQQNPLRELSIDVKVNSAVPLKSVTSPTHPTRNGHTAHSAHVEFTAQQYTPTRDFEVAIEVEGRQADVVMIPHRRGDDGYFMLQLMPPGAAGDWDRPILPNGEPLQLLILADTSASIDATQRATQAMFIGSLLAALSPKDTFNLATCDVTCDWAFAKATSADANHVSAARDFLAKRSSLGWTDLDKTFAAAVKRCGPKTHVIYVGDGITTTGDADPIAFTKRLLQLPETMNNGGGTFHSVALGSSYEPAVLKAIASLGSGSMRKITSEQGPAAVARELLGEIAQPALRDIKVEFKGFKAARVYPETLANVPAGTQQILLGRYLPDGRDQAGEVIVTGTQGGKPVRFSTRASFKDAELGNSFIPRLWARMHLDSLLEQGSSDAIKDEIIALSEEFQIITPYTSLLVLETDADRERFKVKRRFQMRDGERFFADGRDNAVFDLAQKQMKNAGAWRTALRRSVLGELAQLGREPRLFRPHRRYSEALNGAMMRGAPLSMLTGALGIGGSFDFAPMGSMELLGEDRDEFGSAEREPDSATKFEREALEAAPTEPANQRFGLEQMRAEPALFNYELRPGSFDLALRDDDDTRNFFLDGFSRDNKAQAYGRDDVQWLNTLFPSLPKAPGKLKEPKSSWPAPARDLARSLLRTEQLARMTGAIEIVRQTETFDTRWGDLASRSRRLELVAAKSWLTRSASDDGQTLVTWCNDKEIGVFSKAFQFGRLRAATPLDLQPPPLELRDYSLSSLERAYPDYAPTLEPQGKDRTMFVLKHGTSRFYETRILIDTDRHVILSIEDRHKGKATSVTRFEDFVQAAGSWWGRRIETTNHDGKRQALVTQTVKVQSLKELETQTKAELADRAQVAFLHLPMPSVAAAKKALAVGKTSFDDRLALLLHFEHSQQWGRVLDQLQQAEKVAVGKPGLRWLRSTLLHDSRRHEELRLRYLDDAARLAKTPSADAYFLANYLVDQSSGILQANEMLALLDMLQPLYNKQPAHVHAGKRWRQLRASNLTQAGRSEESLMVQKGLATDYPRDYSLQQEYAQALANAGDFPAAYAWLTRVLVKEAKWLTHEEEYLRTTYTRLLDQQGRSADLAAYLAEWIKQNPETGSAYDQYLIALIKSDQIEKADALMTQWLKEGRVPGELPHAVAVRLHSAVYLMLGNSHHLHTNRIEERWLTPLAQTVLFFARHETHAAIADRIMENHQFVRSEEARKVRQTVAGILTAEIDKLPAEQIQRLVGWVQAEDAEPAAWNKIVGTLRQRWTNEAKVEVKHLLGQVLVRVLSRPETPNEPLAFLRLQRQAGPEKHRAQYANQLFDHLIGQPWSSEFEDEALTLLDQLSAAEEPGARRFAAVAALHRLTDRLVEARIAARMKALEHPEKLTRIELRKKQEEIRRLAREGLADRLRKQAAKEPKALAPWLLAESAYLDVLLDRNLKQAAADAWAFVGAAPQKQNADEPTLDHVLDDILRHRYVITLTNLAARKGAEPALVERLLKYVDQGITLPDDADASRWKQAKYRLLVALDRTKELEQTLGPWTQQDDPDHRWRVALAYLMAEQGRLAEAIRTFEAIEAADALTPAAYRVLADWYLVQSQREASERAAAAVYATTPEHHLSQMIAHKLQPWQRRDGHLPSELDKEVLRMFAVLFDKSATPHSYLDQLQQFYQTSRDFRLLSGLPDAVIGHTAASVYPFVEGMRSVLDEVRDEATADEIVKRIAEVRPRAKTAVDQRALDLLEVLVERRAAEVQNQPGPHQAKALAAMQRAFKRDWSPGEPRLMADFLYSLTAPIRAVPGAAQPALTEEQLRQLKALHAMTAAGSSDRLHVAYRHALTLRGYQKTADAIDLLQTALDEYQTANDGVLPVAANDPLDSLVDSLEYAGHFARGEKVLVAQLAHPVHAQQRRWLINRLDGLYLHALERGGEVSFGKGAALYKALNAKLQKDLVEPDPLHRYQLVTLLCQVYRAAHDKKLPGVAGDVRAFAFEIAPPLVKGLAHYHPPIVGVVAQTVHDLAGPKDGIVFLLNEIDSEPRWLRYNRQDGWSRYSGSLADWRRQAPDLGAVEGRLLKRVLAELRRDLETREDRTRAMYHQHASPGYFWKEKAADFAKTADAVLAERSESAATVQYVADYFYWGLGDSKRAIEILFVAHGKRILDEDGQAKLVDFLHRENRHGESIAILQPLVERRPTNLEYRVRLMHAYFRTARKAELLALLKQTDTFFHEKDRWGEHALDRLAHSALQNELYEQSIAYFKELVPLHERTHPNRGVGNGTLAGYYIGLANAYAGLKKTPEAVEAAGGAIVAWGPRHNQRATALVTLKQVLLRSADLDAFAAQFDNAKKDSSIIRKALGQAYGEKKQYARAIAQLERAAALQPNDAETYQLLIAAHDTLDDKDGAVRQLLQAVQLSRRDLKFYQELGKRYIAAEQPIEAERAYTSIVEVLPTESESHALLAEVREKQDRWSEAMHHWEQVARLRALEPTGLLKLAAAQIHEKQWEQARATLRKLDTRTWPPHFADVRGQVRALAEKIKK